MDGKENEKMRATNLTLLTDLYELTMMQGYFKNPTDQIVVFDAFYRKNPCDGGYAISCGLSDVIDYIKNLHFSYDDIQYLKSLNIFDEDFLDYLAGFHFTGDIWGIPEGTVIFPREPMLKVIAPIEQAQLVETAVGSGIVDTAACFRFACEHSCVAVADVDHYPTGQREDLRTTCETLAGLAAAFEKQ